METRWINILTCRWLLSLLIVGFPVVTRSCILLLNGWEPLTMGQRALLADIVLTVQTLDTFKTQRTEAQTYTAEFQTLRVLKGVKTLQNSVKPDRGATVYNISNFGDKTMCYADVDSGETYILFLTVFEGRLSAKYDDIFGAAAEYSEENEEDILLALGWKPWATWTTCTRSCGGGVQTRKRACDTDVTSECEGLDGEQRKCNLFSCKGTKDLLNIMGITRLPSGVSRLKTRPGAYHIDEEANISTPTSRIFTHSQGFPRDFSLIATTRPKEGNQGYLFTVVDLLGFVKLAVQVGTYPVFEYADDTGEPGGESPRFAVEVSDNRWHQLAYSIRGRTITLHLDCMHVIQKVLDRNPKWRLGPNTVASVGKTFTDRKQYPRFQGDIEQLVISSDPDAASHYCDMGTNAITELPHNNGDVPTSSEEDFKTSKEKEKDGKDEEGETVSKEESASSAAPTKVLWSDWSPCSVTCGTGVQTRSAYCADNEVPIHECLGAARDSVESKTCYPGACPVHCHFPCVNGGVCVRPGRCACPDGYYGQQCERVSCYPVCYNGGRCVEPNRCSCPPGYEGEQCEIARCDQPCQNGGHCSRPGMCSCPYGYLPPDCRPICSTQCYNGGSCIGYNYCRCQPGYTGHLCQNAICPRGCGLGGRCIAPNTCICTAGYTGPDCRNPVCVPACQNGGSCLYPYFCLCPSGTYGPLCEQFLCSPGCQNGGTCIGLNTCSCPSGYSGRYCELSNCPAGCENGATCVALSRCKCKTGFYGPRCERKKCTMQSQLETYQGMTKQRDIEKYTENCGLWGFRSCTKYRTVYRMVPKTFHRTVYKCV